MAVCSRCASLYLGVLATSIIYPFTGRRSAPRARFLLLAATPLVLAESGLVPVSAGERVSECLPSVCSAFRGMQIIRCLTSL